MHTLYVMILCITPSNYGQQCLQRDFPNLDDCKAFVAAAEPLVSGGDKYRKALGICVPARGVLR